MIKNIIIRCGLILLVLIAIVFTIENIKDHPKTILNNISIEKKCIETGKRLPKEGERLSYLIKYLWIIPIGVAEIEIGEKGDYKNHKVYPLMAKGRTSDFISSFVKAEGTIKSYVDVNKLYTWRYEEKTHAEGHRPSDKIIFYKQDAQIMEFRDIKRKIPKNTQDPLSALFYLRWQKYEEGENIIFNVNSNKENYTLHTKFLRQDTIPYNGKERELLVLESYIKSPKEYSKSEAKITTFMTDDATRVPFLLKIRTKFGPLIVRLTNIKYN